MPTSLAMKMKATRIIKPTSTSKWAFFGVMSPYPTVDIVTDAAFQAKRVVRHLGAKTIETQKHVPRLRG
eukprot:7911329-Pyramimonas_sp.AAC.1